MKVKYLFLIISTTFSFTLYAQINRPQEPKAPFKYTAENVKFKNNFTDSITLAGTLTYPKEGTNFPAVILISGSGPQDRNSEIMNHKPFLVIADYLTKNGIVVLRLDDRGTGESEGNYNETGLNGFVNDTKSALEFLKSRKEVNHTKIGLIGHSMGGVIAPIVASENPDISFIVLLAGSGIRGDQLMLLQKEKIERKMGVPELGIIQGQNNMKGAYDIILKSDTTNANTEIVEYYQENQKSILYKFQNLDILNSIGTSNLKGSIDLKNNRIDFLGTGKINEKFIFKNDVQLNSTNYGWAEFSGNFNTNQIPKTILKQIKMDRNLDGRIVLSIHQIKKIAKLLSKIDLNTFYKHFDLNILVGHQKLDSLAFDKKNSEFNYSLNNEFKCFSMTNYPKNYSLKVEKNNFFQFFIDFEKMIAQNHDEWAWNRFKTLMKKMNFKKLDIICLEKNKTEFEIKGRLTSLDSSKNIVLNPFIY